MDPDLSGGFSNGVAENPLGRKMALPLIRPVIVDNCS
jgi:hypothetical protein